MTWDDLNPVAFDCETSGEITGADKEGRPTSEYALQPWRIPQGKAWITSASAIRLVPDQGLVPHLSQLYPTREQLEQLLRDAVENRWTIVGWNIAFDIALLIAVGLEDLVMRVTWLDGMLLWRHLDIEPEYEFATRKHLKKSRRLKPNAVETFIPTFAGLDEDVDFHATDPESLRKLQLYNDRDNVRAWTISKIVWDKLTDKQRRAAMIEAEALPLVAQANFHGLEIDRLTARHLGARLDMDAAARLAELAPHGMTEKVVRSPKQLGDLMFNTPDEGGWGLPVLKTNKSKVEGKPDSRSTDKEVLHELAFIDARVKRVKEYREALNAKGKFATSVLESVAYNGDWRTHPVANIFATYCVPGDVEVLTREGWVALRDWAGGEIAQVWPDRRIEFLPAAKFIGPVVDEWVRVSHRRLRCDFTLGHTMPYLHGSDWRTTQAGSVLSGTPRDIPVAGTALLNGSLTKDQMCFLAATQADGSFGPWGLKFCFEKPRKIVRMDALIARLGLRCRRYVRPKRAWRVEFHISKTRLPEWVTPDRKTFGPWVLDTIQAGLSAFVRELQYWDGSSHVDGGFRFVSKERVNVEWAVTAAALAGRKASLHALNTDGMSSCHISDPSIRNIVGVCPGRHTSLARETRQAFCAETQTGFWLARSQGQIFVTGNTGRMTVSSKQGKGKEERPIGFALHQMKREAEFREIVTVPEGFDLVEFDAAGQEYRWMAVASRDATMLQMCLPGEDMHSFMGARIVSQDYRDLVKRVGAGDLGAGQTRYLGKFANLCISEGAKILTDRGICNIEDVRLSDRVWDGAEFVVHEGVRFSGAFPVISHQGVTATPEHKVLVDGRWTPISEAAQHGWTIEPALGSGWASKSRAAVRIVGGLVCRALCEVGSALCEGALSLRKRARRTFEVSGDRSIHPVQGMRHAAAACAERAPPGDFRRRPATPKARECVVPTLSQHQRPLLSQLRWARDRVSVFFGARGGGVCEASAATPHISEARHRPPGQRWSLRAWKLALGFAQGEPCEQAAVRRTYDIVNCGPRTRFAANGRIVHNSLQYRTSAKKLRVKARVDYEIPMELPEAQRIWKTYQITYPGVPVYWREQIAIVRSCGYVETFGGNRIQVVGNWGGGWGWSMGSTAINARIQGTGADQKHLAMAVIKSYLNEIGGRFLFDLHDGLYLAIPSAIRPTAVIKMKRMLDNLPYQQAWGFTPPIPMPWDCKIGKAWGRLKTQNFE